MRRVARGLYTEGRWAVTRDCDCGAADCGSRWTLREIVRTDSDGWPHYGSEILSSASTKAELLAELRGERL